MLKRGAAIALTLVLLGGGMIATIWASTVGYGLTEPEVEPPSIREESTHTGSSRRGILFLRGRGIHSGK